MATNFPQEGMFRDEKGIVLNKTREVDGKTVYIGGPCEENKSMLIVFFPEYVPPFWVLID